MRFSIPTLTALCAIIIFLVGLVLGPIFDANITAYIVQHHWDSFIPPLIVWLLMFSHTWWGGVSLGVLITLLVVLFVLVVWKSCSDYLTARDQEQNPMKIEFDPKNPSDHFWNERHISPEEQNDYAGQVVTVYRVKLTNNTPKTIKNVKISRLFGGGRRDFISFPSVLVSTFDLHPNAEEYVPVYEFDEMRECFCESEPDYQSSWSFKLQITGIDVKMCEKNINIDVSKMPILSIS